MNEQPIVFSFERPHESPGFLFWQITHLWQRRVNHTLEPVNLTHMQFIVLATVYWLGTQQKSVTQVEISEHAQIDKMMTSNVLRTLEKKELVIRSEHRADTRAKRVQVTEAGESLLIRAVQLVESADRDFFDEILTHDADFNRRLQDLLILNQS